MIQKKWFRVEQNKDGDILSCDEVECKGRQGAIVRYYEAADKAEACSLAKQWADNYRTIQNKHSEKLRNKRADSCLCLDCGLPALADRSRCEKCLKTDAKKGREYRKRKRLGLPQLLHKLPDQERWDNRKQQYTKSNNRRSEIWGSSTAHRYFLLLKKLHSLGAEAYEHWLREQITLAGGAKALADYEESRVKHDPVPTAKSKKEVKLHAKN